MRRKPSGSHWVQNMPLERNRPSSAVLAAGSISVTISSVKLSGTTRDGQALVVQQIVACAQRAAVQRHRQQFLVFALQNSAAGRPRLPRDRQLGGDPGGLRGSSAKSRCTVWMRKFRRLVIGKMNGAGFFGTHGEPRGLGSGRAGRAYLEIARAQPAASYLRGQVCGAGIHARQEGQLDLG